MPKSRYLRVAVTGVAICGLTSCSKEKSTAAPGPSAPVHTVRAARRLQNVFVGPKGQTHQPLAVWMGQKDRSLNLNDEIEVGQDGPAFTDVVATCSNEDKPQLVQHTHFERASVLPLYKVLPEEMLTRDLTRRPVSCNINVQLSDDSFTKFSNPFLADFVGDAGDLGIHTESATSKHPVKLRAVNLQGLRIQTNRDARLARLMCADANFPPAAVEHRVLDLNTFLTDHPIIKEGHEFDVPLAGRPDQLCRVAFYEANSPLPDEITRSFQLNFDNGTLRIHKSESNEMKVGLLTRTDTDMALGEYEIENLTDHDRVMKLGQDRYRARLRVNHFPDITNVSTIEVPWVQIYRDLAIGTVPFAPNETFVIPANGSLKISPRFFAHGSLACPHARVRVQVTDKIYLHEVAPDGNIIDTKILEPFDERTRVAKHPKFSFAGVRETTAPQVCPIF